MGRTVALGGGVHVPYPEPTSADATKIGKANRRVDTKAEVRIRSGVHRLGFRFRKDRLLRVGSVRVHPDIVFPTEQVAVFIDGCFWHSCPEHCHTPRSNTGYWLPKLAANIARDRRVDSALADNGWTGLRIWEHVPVAEAVAQIASVVLARRPWLSHDARTVPTHEHPDATS